MDAPIPGIAPWDDIVKNPALWHFSFNGPDAERLVAGRERIYLDRIWNAFSGDPKKPDEATRAFYAAQYAQPGAMRAPLPHCGPLAIESRKAPISCVPARTTTRCRRASRSRRISASAISAPC